MDELALLGLYNTSTDVDLRRRSSCGKLIQSKVTSTS